MQRLREWLSAVRNDSRVLWTDGLWWGFVYEYSGAFDFQFRFCWELPECCTSWLTWAFTFYIGLPTRGVGLRILGCDIALMWGDD